MSPELMGLVVSVIAIIVAIFAIARSGKPVTLNTVTDSLEAAIPFAEELAQVALTGVRASEQLYLTGKITKDERFTEAVRYFKKWFPDLDEDTVVKNVEAAVLIMNQLGGALPTKRTISTPRVTTTGLV